MTETLLKHMVAMTCHRDQGLLDTSIIAALQELTDAGEAQVLDIFKLNDELYVRKRVWIDDGNVVSASENELEQQTGEPIGNYPALISCILEHKLMATEVVGENNYKLWLPVWLNDKITTCIELSNSQAFSDDMLRVIEGILNIYRNYQNLLDYSERDSLTGLLNRKTFDERFSKMLSNNGEPEDPTLMEQPERRHMANAHENWLAVVDIDHFKKVNDQFGHLYGDEVLILVANRLRSSFRAQDRVFRFGGEEFVVLLRSTTLAYANKIFERFRSNVESHEFPQVGTVTVSVGFAHISNETPVVILGHADQALYYAKANGRNRVCHYDHLVRSGLLLSEQSNESVEFFFDEPE